MTLLHRSTFSYASALTEVTLPDGLVEIRDWAFGHTGLKRVDLPSSVKLVDYAAFGGCPLTDIYYDGTPAKWKKVVFDPSYDDYLLGCTIHFSDGTVDDTLTNLLSRGSCGDDLTWSVDKDGVLTIAGTGAMDNYAKYTHTIYDAWGREDRVESYYTYPWYDVSNRICAVRLEEGVESIGNMAFSEMETLQCISLPLSLKSVVQGAFKGTGLKDVYYAGTEAQWSEVRRQWNNEPLNEAAFHFKSTDMPLPDFILWSYDSGTLRISGNGRMEDYAATKDSGKTWTFTSPPWWYWNSEGSAEENRSQINTVVVEGNVTYVGNGAFRDLENLEKVVLGDKVTDVGAFAFENDAKLEKVAIPAGVTQIADRAFYDCPKLTDLEVAGGNTAYKSVDGVLFTKDGSELVCYGAGRTAPEYRVPYGVTTLRPSAFSYNAALTGVTLPETLAEIGDWAFGHTGLKTVTLPASVKTLRHDAFGGCARLTKAYVAVGLATVREKAFDDSALKDVYYAGTEAQWDAVSVNSNNRGLLLATMHYGSSVKLAKKALQLPADLKVIGPSAFEGGAFTHVYLGEKVTTIEARAFANCAELSCIFIPKATKSIANDAFIGCADVVIVCKADSAAQKYAEARGINYLIEE